MRRPRGVSPVPRGPRALKWLALVTAITSALALCVSSTARADTLSSDQAEASAITAKLAQLSQAEDAADERYDQDQITLGNDEARQQAAQAAESRAAASVAAKRRILQQAAVNAYVEGGQASSIAQLIQSDAAEIGAQESYLDSVVDSQQAAVDGFKQAEAALGIQEAAFARASRAASAQVQAVAATKTELASTVDQEQSTLSSVKGQIASIVAADEQAAEEIQAAKAKAAYEAQQQALAAQAAEAAQGGGSDGSGDMGDTSVGNLPPAPNPGAAAAIQYAEEQLGKPYQYGAAGPDSFDCSGLTMMAWEAGGVSLPHSAAEQWDDTTRVSYSQLEPGDLVFFYQPVDHVGIYVGNDTMIDAPHTGADVEYDSIWWSGLDGFGRVT